MSAIEHARPSRSLFDRARNILLQPKQEWEVIDLEPTSAGQLYASYVVPLSAIPVIAGLIGMSLIGINVPTVGKFRMPIAMGIGNAVVRYILGLVAVYVAALIIDALAPTFSGTRDRLQALKVAAYSYTAAWVAGILMIIPALFPIVGLLSLYCLYLLYKGLPLVMHAPREKALAYTAVVVIAEILLWIIIAMIAGAIFGAGVGAGMGAAGMVR